MKERIRPDGSTYLSGRDVERDQAQKLRERQVMDNLTHHLVPRTAGMTCKYCKVVNASTDEVCPVRVEQEGA